MPQASDRSPVNRLIEAASREELRRFLACCETVDLAFGTVLCEQHRPCTHAHLPLTGIVSLMARVGGHPPMEVGMIGSEGMVGASLVLGISTAPQQAIVQAAGSALRIESTRLQAVLAESPGLQRVFNRHLFDLLVQLSRTAACSRFHGLEARLARWLLMSHDRTGGDRLLLTHQFLGNLLGVRRSAVTIAAGHLGNDRLIGVSRGEIRILDRHGLEQLACSCYRAREDRGGSGPSGHEPAPVDHG